MRLIKDVTLYQDGKLSMAGKRFTLSHLQVMLDLFNAREGKAMEGELLSAERPLGKSEDLSASPWERFMLVDTDKVSHQVLNMGLRDGRLFADIQVLDTASGKELEKELNRDLPDLYFGARMLVVGDPNCPEGIQDLITVDAYRR